MLEQRDRLGGVLRTVDLAGAPYDVGAEAFLCAAPRGARAARRAGLADEVVHPAGAAPSVRAGGGTVPLPPGTLLGVPTSARSARRVLSPAGTAAAAAPSATGRSRGRPVATSRSARLLRDRFGDELADRLVDPLLGGVYAGRVDALGLRATLPAVAAALDAGAPSLTAAADRATAVPASRTCAREFVSPGPRRRQTRPTDRGRTRCSALCAAATRRSSTRSRPPSTSGCRPPSARCTGARTAGGSSSARARTRSTSTPWCSPSPRPRSRGCWPTVAPAAARAAGAIELASSVVVALAYRDATRDGCR